MNQLAADHKLIDYVQHLIEPVVLKDHGLAVGIVFVQGAGYRVGTASPDGPRHMSPAAARRLARDLTDSEESAALAPVSAALNETADKVQAISDTAGSA